MWSRWSHLLLTMQSFLSTSWRQLSSETPNILLYCANLNYPLQNVTYENCSCIASNLYDKMTETDFNTILESSTASRGLCPTPCSFLPAFVVLVALFVFLIFLIRVPFLLVTIRYKQTTLSALQLILSLKS